MLKTFVWHIYLIDKLIQLLTNTIIFTAALKHNLHIAKTLISEIFWPNFTWKHYYFYIQQKLINKFDLTFIWFFLVSAQSGYLWKPHEH